MSLRRARSRLGPGRRALCLAPPSRRRTARGSGLRKALGLALLAAWAAPACRGGPEVVGGVTHADRRDYRAFRARFPQLLEPNYLPFMTHRVRVPGAEEDALVFCRFEVEAFPLAVRLEGPELDELQDEFHPTPPERYRASVREAFRSWARELEGPFDFVFVGEGEDADLVVRIRGEEAPVPVPEVRVLGTAPLGRACRILEAEAGAERLAVRFRVPELKIYVADEYGLLTPEQVLQVGRHEIGHALGMRGHSPVPADLMYEVVRDRKLLREREAPFSEQDENSFANLYGLPNGTVYRWIPREGEPEREPEPLPTGPPQLEPAPHVDARLGYSVRAPRGWLRVETPRGMVALDGATWDYRASFQIVVMAYDTLDDFLGRFAGAYLRGGRLVEQTNVIVQGREALRLVKVDDRHHWTEEFTFLASGDGRVFVVVADAASEEYEAFRPWFWAALATLEIWPETAGPGEPGWSGFPR